MCRAIPSLVSSSYGAEICPGTALPLTDLNSMKYVILKVLTAGTIKVIDFWDMLACTSVNIYQHFYEMYCLHLQNLGIIRVEKKCPSQNRLCTACRYQGKLDKIPFPSPVYMW
jgi:hypothetical protein